MKGIDDAMMAGLSQALDLRAKRQELLAGNLANVDTPGYQPVDMAFEAALTQALDTGGRAPRLAGTDPKHMRAQAQAPQADDTVVLRPDVVDSLDGNGVDLDQEVARFVDNATRYRATAEVIRRRYALMNQILTQAGGR